MQILIVWNSDLPEEAAWYLHRISSGWAWIAGLIALLHFFLPFFVLLWPQMQRSRRRPAIMAATLVVAAIPRAWWLVLPSSPQGFNWTDVAAMLAVVGLATGRALARRASDLFAMQFGSRMRELSELPGRRGGDTRRRFGVFLRLAL